MNAGTHSPAQLSEQQRRQFERDGYLCPIRVLDDREVERHLTSYMEYSAANKARLDALPPNQKYQGPLRNTFRAPLGLRDRDPPARAGRGRRAAWTEPARLEQQLVHQDARREIVRQLASGRNLLEAESADGGHRLGGAVAERLPATAACA